MDEKHARLHAEIDGHVQGVGFRYFVLEQANQLKLAGWTRNTWAGKVEVTAEGSRPDLEILLERLRGGPRSAFVTGVDYEWSEATGEYQGFKVLSTS